MLKSRRDEDSNIEWSDVTDFRTEYSGEAEHKDTVRKGSKLLYEYLDAGWNLNNPVSPIVEIQESKSLDCSEINLKIQELQKERQKFFDQRVAYNKIIRERARQEELNDIINDVVKNGSLPSLYYIPNKIQQSDNDMLISLCDLHYGANIDNAWNFYNSDVCRARLNTYIDEIAGIQKIHNSENCIVWVNGDEISGNIHNEITITNKENVIEQIIGVSELIAGFISEVSKLFKRVSFVSVAGNHSRIDTKDKSLKDERLDDLVEWYLKARLQNFDNVIIGDCTKLDTTMYLTNIRGLNYIGVHGDIDIGENKILSLKSFVREPVYAVLSGHFHHNKLDSIQGIKTIMAGSFLGIDQFCISKRIYGQPQQLLCICDNKGVRCSYDINF